MEIFVKQMGSKNADRLQFRLEPSENIGSLRKQIAEKLAISEDCIKLIHKGRLFARYFSHAFPPWTGLVRVSSS
jgi:hypothetical protein